MILGTRFEILGTRIGLLKRLKKTLTKQPEFLRKCVVFFSCDSTRPL